MADKERIQLNLLAAIKEAASAEGISINSWAVDALAEKLGIASKPAHTEELEAILDKLLDIKLDRLLADKLATLRTEPVGKLAA
jgi:putative ubiquitin-RnfH superfamily antitoxin RatB of RatAB toxin-antitoxin module